MGNPVHGNTPENLPDMAPFIGGGRPLSGRASQDGGGRRDVETKGSEVFERQGRVEGV